MRIVCPMHGGQAVVQISPDVWDDPQAAQREVRWVHVLYEFDGQVVDAYHLSEEFAARHGVEAGVAPLPADYPEWTGEVTRVCAKCFEARGWR